MKPRHKIPSEKDLGFKLSFWNRVFNNKKTVDSNHHGHENIEPEDIKINTIAVVLDGKVWEVLRAQDRLAELFLAQPTFVLVEDDRHIHIGSDYIEGEFLEQQRDAKDTATK